MLGALKLLFKGLYLLECIDINPCEDIVLYTKEKVKPKEIFSQKEIEKILDSIDNPCSRALFELMYSSGLRVSEAARLNIGDIDFENRLIHVRQAKFSKDRIVPMSKVAAFFVKEYLSGRSDPDQAVFFGRQGRLGTVGIRKRFTKILKKQKIYREGLSVHSIRHSTGTHLLENGADLRYVQELLGHKSIETTTVYTHLMYENLRRIYKTFHPRENEYFCEVNEQYLSRLDEFYSQLKKQKGIREKKKAIKRRYVLKKKNKKKEENEA
jgi:site-specific recombinase XerD